MRKETSTNALNEKRILDSCGMAYALSIFGGRWKPAILCHLRHGTMRFSELKGAIEGISERMLAAQLRELQKGQVIERFVYPEVPARVEYQLSAFGNTLVPVLAAISDWGNQHRAQAGTEAQ